MRAGVSGGQNHIPWHLVFDVEVVLLNHALYEVTIHGLNGSSVRTGIDRCVEDSTARNRRRRRSTGLEKEAIRETAPGGAESGTKAGRRIHFRIIGWILPQALPALIPCGIVEYRVAPTDCNLVASRRLPGKPEARFHSAFLKLNAGTVVGTDASGAPGQPGASCRHVPPQVLNIEVCLPILDFSFGGSQGPGKSDVECHIRGYAPIILDKWTDQFLASTDRTPKERLIMSRERSHTSQQEVTHIVASGFERADLGNETVLESVITYVHFLGAVGCSEPDVMFAANQVKRVGNGVDIGSTLVGSVSTISQ